MEKIFHIRAYDFGVQFSFKERFEPPSLDQKSSNLQLGHEGRFRLVEELFFFFFVVVVGYVQAMQIIVKTIQQWE